MPYSNLVRNTPHADSVVKNCEQFLSDNYHEIDAIKQVIAMAGVPERTLKRRFKAATGSSLIEYIQNLRVENAKRLLETCDTAIEEISASIGYMDTSFFRRLFKRLTGLSPG